MAVVDETLGWNVAPIFRYGDLALLAAIVVVASAVTSIYPAWFASRAGALEMFAAE
jgi:ABC-type lipoprotein release transport system permease subunit